MIKADSDYEVKARDFDHMWILNKVKTIVVGLDTKLNQRVSLHAAITNFILLKQFANETNDAYFTRFKLMVQTLQITGGEHVLISRTTMKVKLGDATAN